MRKMARVAIVAVGLLVLGCQQEDKPTDVRSRQDAALRDPMNYGSNISDRNDISGGGILDLRKDAFKKDVNAVFNP